MQQSIMSHIDPSTLVTFAFVCDGEVAEIIKIPPSNERFIAALQSEPIIVQVNQGENVTWGDMYVNGEFVKP